MKYLWILALCFTYNPLLFPNTGYKKAIVDCDWWCPYCGYKNSDKNKKCKNWNCPTNKPKEYNR